MRGGREGATSIADRGETVALGWTLGPGAAGVTELESFSLPLDFGGITRSSPGPEGDEDAYTERREKRSHIRSLPLINETSTRIAALCHSGIERMSEIRQALESSLDVRRTPPFVDRDKAIVRSRDPVSFASSDVEVSSIAEITTRARLFVFRRKC